MSQETTTEVKIGNIYKRELGQCPHLVLVLSSDRQPGWEVQEGIDVYRCTQFQISFDGRLFGAQIVLYTNHELESFEFFSNFSRYITEKIFQDIGSNKSRKVNKWRK